MKLKKILASALVFATMFSASSAFALVGAEPYGNDEAAITGTIPIEEELMNGNFTIGGQPVNLTSLNKLAPVVQYGTVAFLEDDRIMLMGTDANGEKYAKLILNLSDSTLILNAVSGEPVALESIREGELLYAYVSPVMALSMPAQASAELLLVDIPADFVMPVYAEINNIFSGDNGTLTLITDQGVNLIVNAETALSPFLSRQFLTAEMLRPGQKILAWCGPTNMSYPAQTIANKLIAFNFGYAGSLSVDSDGIITINDEALRFDRLAMPFIQDGAYLVPFRKVVESLGCTVTWNSDDNSISVSKDDALLYAFAAGADFVTADSTERSVTHALDSVLGITYMSIDDIVALHNLKFIG